MRESPVAQRTNTTINIPNILTLVRILLTPLLIIFLIKKRFTTALLVFAVAGISDALDGFIARYFSQRTVLGAHLDPLADKLLLLSSYISLAVLKIIPGWLAVVVIARDVIIMFGIAVLTITHKTYEIKPTTISKCTTAIQLTTIFFVLLHPDGIHFSTLQISMFWATAALTIASGLHYIYIGMNQLQENDPPVSPPNSGSTD
jgi:cardiolipin synthase